MFSSSSSSSYQNVPSEPPAYDDFQDDIEQRGQQHHYMRQSSDPFYVRAHRYTKNRILMPMQRQVLDPLAEMYGDLLRLAELYMAKLGNPLIVKRFLYVGFISVVMVLVMKTGLVPQDSMGAGTGAVASFSDLGKLRELIDDSDTMVDLKAMEENLEYLSSVSHEAGTVGDLALAKYVHGYFKQFGSIAQTQLMEVRTLLDYPETVALSYEDTTLDLSEQFSPLSKDTDLVEGGVLYVNYGTPRDYQNIGASGLSCQDKIVIVKIGQIPIFQKIQVAESFKVKAMLFINEYETHPESFTPVSAAMSNYYPGDPMTPGYSSMLSDTRVALEQSRLSSIPTVSLSRLQASPILAKLAAAEEGGFSFPDGISSGDGTFQVKLTNKLQYRQDHSIWNVIGKMEGREQSDQALIIGARRDSLTSGTMSANSGTVVLLQVMEMFHKLTVKFRWKPLRSIYFISFDAADYNWAGATELVEGKIAENQRDTIAFIDISDGVTQQDDLIVRSTGLLDSKLTELSNDHPFKWANFQKYSNMIPFMQYGVPVVQLGYQNDNIKDNYPVATNEDTFATFKSLEGAEKEKEKFITLSQLVTKLALDTVDEPLIPFDISQFVSKLDHHYHNLQEYQESQTNAERLDYNPIITPLLRLSKIGKDFQAWKDGWAELIRSDSGVEPSLFAVHRWGWNSRLNILEKVFTDVNGISEKRRTFKNVLYGPQFFKPVPDQQQEEDQKEVDWFTWPSIRDVIDEAGDIQAEIERVGKIIDHGIDYFFQRWSFIKPYTIYKVP